MVEKIERPKTPQDRPKIAQERPKTPNMANMIDFRLPKTPKINLSRIEREARLKLRKPMRLTPNESK